MVMFQGKDMDMKAEIFRFGGAVSSDLWILWAFQDLEAFLARKVRKAFAALILFWSLKWEDNFWSISIFGEELVLQWQWSSWGIKDVHARLVFSAKNVQAAKNGRTGPPLYSDAIAARRWVDSLKVEDVEAKRPWIKEASQLWCSYHFPQRMT